MFEAFWSWAEKIYPTILAKTQLGKAFDYAFKCREYLGQHRIYTISGCDDMKNPSAKVQRDRNVFNYLSQDAHNQTVRDFLSAR